MTVHIVIPKPCQDPLDQGIPFTLDQAEQVLGSLQTFCYPQQRFQFGVVHGDPMPDTMNDPTTFGLIPDWKRIQVDWIFKIW